MVGSDEWSMEVGRGGMGAPLDNRKLPSITSFHFPKDFHLQSCNHLFRPLVSCRGPVKVIQVIGTWIGIWRIEALIQASIFSAQHGNFCNTYIIVIGEIKQDSIIMPQDEVSGLQSASMSLLLSSLLASSLMVLFHTLLSAFLGLGSQDTVGQTYAELWAKA